jgi:glycerophosphoryl diester phosphodiesterase
LISSFFSIQEIKKLLQAVLVLKSLKEGNAMQRKLEIPGKEKPYLMAHRGNREFCPENTLISFRHAFQDGADILETDLHLSKDGQFICIHDGTVDRTTDGSGKIADLTVVVIKKVSAFNHMAGFENERIPLLSETAAILPANVALALELKSDRFLEEKICRQLVGELKEYGIFDRTIVLSFSAERVFNVRKVEKDMPIGLITMKKIFPPADVDMVGPFFPILWANPWYIHAAHRTGMLVCPLDPTPEPRLAGYLRRGCDAIITDNPAVTRKAMDALLNRAKT